MSAPEDHGSDGNKDVRFEPTDVSSRPVVIAVLSLAIFTLVFTFVAHLTFKALAARQEAASPPASPLAEYAAKQPPEPRLQEQPKDDLQALHAAEDKTLSTLAWVDKSAGIVQVPIERAMEMLLAKGLPARQGPVPIKMSPHGVAPTQHSEGSGAPDWQVSSETGHAAGESGHGETIGKAEHAPSHEPAAEAHGH